MLRGGGIDVSRIWEADLWVSLALEHGRVQQAGDETAGQERDVGKAEVNDAVPSPPQRLGKGRFGLRPRASSLVHLLLVLDAHVGNDNSACARRLYTSSWNPMVILFVRGWFWGC